MNRLNWSKMNGLIPAIVQNSQTGQVLMLGYMNEEALLHTQESKRVTFYSRSKQRLWVKGESSGHYLTVQTVIADCDGDSLLILAIPKGPTCHTGDASCFKQPNNPGLALLPQLEQTIQSRINEGNNDSYCASIAKQGVKRAAQKVGEEGVEVALAAVGNNDRELVNESADLLFHLLLLWQIKGLDLSDVLSELSQRHQA